MAKDGKKSTGHGRNTPSGDIILSYVERIERLKADQKALADDIKAVKAEAKANGYSPKAIDNLVKRRSKKPQDLAESETIDDLYRHAIGMDAELPLFRSLATAVSDPGVQDQVLDALKDLAPLNGDILMRMGGKQLRIWRDKDGTAHAEDYTPPAASAPGGAGSPDPSLARMTKPRADVPDCSEDEAEEMGQQAARDNKPVIANPFPYNDKRRPRWDLGWRKETGNNGFGGK